MAMKHFIAGNWFSGSGEPFESFNPANGDSLWQGRAANQSEVNMAVEAARNALGPWSLLSIDERLEYIRKFKIALEQDAATLTESISLDSGKPYWEAQTEVRGMINKVDISIEAYEKRTYTRASQELGANAYIRYKPIGVMAVLGPFNFPGHLPNGHIVPALIAGNTIVFKPSEYTPLVAERMIHCWRQTGIPDGVINMVHGSKETGQALLAADINAVLFTGSYATGKAIHEQFAGRPEVLLALEMGGNSPFVIDEVNDINPAVYFTIISAFLSAGQRCSCARRLMLPNTPQGDDILNLLIQTTENIHIGEYQQSPQPFMGPLIDKTHALHYLEKQRELIDLGGKSLLEMKPLRENTGFVSAGIIDMTESSTVYDEEIFAPLLQVYRYDDFEEAITLANNTGYGLAAGLMSDHPSRYQEFYQHVNAGIINWNRPITGASSRAPFGGVGKSGNHRPSAYFASDYCAYPVASLEQEQSGMPEQILPGLTMPHGKNE